MAFVCFYSGGYGEGETPVPIPNTEVKPLIANGTASVTVWESRTLPGLYYPYHYTKKQGALTPCFFMPFYNFSQPLLLSSLDPVFQVVGLDLVDHFHFSAFLKCLPDDGTTFHLATEFIDDGNPRRFDIDVDPGKLYPLRDEFLYNGELGG